MGFFSRLLVLASIVGATGCDGRATPGPAVDAAPHAGSAVRATLPDGSILELAAPPRRVIPGNAAAAEFIAPLLGAERIAALPEQVDGYSSFDFKLHGFERIPRFARYAAEPLIAMHPDLVITHTWQAAETSSVLREQGTPVLVLRSAMSYADVRATLLLLAQLFDLEAKGAALVSDLDRRVAALRAKAEARASVPPGAEDAASGTHGRSVGMSRALVYSNDGSGGWAAGSDTTADTLLRLAGLRNAAAEAGIKGHASLDFEKLLAIDPDVFVVAAPARGEGGSATKSVLESTAGLAGMKAIQSHRIVVLSAALLASDSPCLVDGAEALARGIDALGAGAAPGPRKHP
jgi:iron complex transport system substrate-binding protein